MGITADEFFENIYSVIFSPKAFYENKDVKFSLRVAFGTILFVTFINRIAQAVLDGSVAMITFISSLIWHLVLICVVWFLTSLFFEYTAKIFSHGGNLSKILFYTAFAPIPYIFFAPLNLVKQAGTLGYILGTSVEFFIYIWIIILYAYSIRAAYNISLARAFMLIFLPFISAFFVIYWSICFFSKMGYIFSV